MPRISVLRSQHAFSSDSSRRPDSGRILHGAADLYKISLDELIGRRTLITEESSYEQQILNVVETMDDTKKELSLRLLNEVAQQRGDKDGE